MPQGRMCKTFGCSPKIRALWLPALVEGWVVADRVCSRCGAIKSDIREDLREEHPELVVGYSRMEWAIAGGCWREYSLYHAKADHFDSCDTNHEAAEFYRSIHGEWDPEHEL